MDLASILIFIALAFIAINLLALAKPKRIRKCIFCLRMRMRMRILPASHRRDGHGH